MLQFSYVAIFMEDFHMLYAVTSLELPATERSPNWRQKPTAIHSGPPKMGHLLSGATENGNL